MGCASQPTWKRARDDCGQRRAGRKYRRFRQLAHQGITLVGQTQSFTEGKAFFRDDLADNIRLGDASYLALLDAADDYIARNGLTLPEEPEARLFLPDPDCLTHPLAELDLQKAGVRSIIWATGYTTDYRWLKVDAFNEQQRPQHHRGVSSEPGVYFLGLIPGFLVVAQPLSGAYGTMRNISPIRIAIQRQYQHYQPSC